MSNKLRSAAFLFHFYNIVALVSISNGLILRDNVEQCENLTLLQYQNPPGPLTALASLPSSGNTWVRHLLQMATGRLTGSVYGEDDGKIHEGFPGSNVHNGSVIVIKDHFMRNMPTTKKISSYDRIILITRNPIFQWIGLKLKAILSRIAFLNGLKGGIREIELSDHEILNYFNKDLARDLRIFVPFWRDWYEFFIDNYKRDQICIISYDDLKDGQADLIQSLRPCVHFLGYQINDPLAQCLRKNQEGRHHRKKRQIEDAKHILSLIPQAERKRYDKIMKKTYAKLAKQVRDEF